MAPSHFEFTPLYGRYLLLHYQMTKVWEKMTVERMKVVFFDREKVGS